MSSTTNKLSQNTIYAAMFWAILLFAWYVWPTPYASYVQDGVVIPNKRISRVTGEIQVYSPDKKDWINESILNTELQLESERIFHEAQQWRDNL